MTDLLERLGWAGLTYEAAIAQAANLLVQHYGLHSSIQLFNTGNGLKLLRKVTRLTGPKRGQVKQRQAEILKEYRRQYHIAFDRRVLRDHHEMMSFSDLREQDGDERFKIFYDSYKGQRIRRLGERYGVHHAVGFRRFGDMLVIATDSFRGLAVRHPDGTVNSVQIFSSNRIDSLDGLLAGLPSGAIYKPESFFARAAMEGAAVTADLRNLQTVIQYHDERVVIAWVCQTIVLPKTASIDEPSLVAV